MEQKVWEQNLIWRFAEALNIPDVHTYSIERRKELLNLIDEISEEHGNTLGFFLATCEEVNSFRATPAKERNLTHYKYLTLAENQRMNYGVALGHFAARHNIDLKGLFE